MDVGDVVDFASYHVDNTIAELIKSGNYKQALKNVDKKRKKGNALRITIVKAALQCMLGDNGSSHETLSDLLAANAAPYDPYVCEQLYTILVTLQKRGLDVQDKTLEDVWVKTIAAEKRQDDKLNLTRDWMSLAIRHQQWNLVVKASQGISSIQSKDDEEVLKQWNTQICARYLFHLQKQQSSGPGSELDRRLALSTLQKAVTDAPEPSESNRPSGKWIASDKQFKLLAEMYQREDQGQQLLEVLRDPKFSHLVKGNNELLYLKAKLWESCPPESRAAAVPWLRDVIKEASEEGGQWIRDDWQIWRLLSKASTDTVLSDRGTDGHSASKFFRQLVTDHLSPPTTNRAPAIAVFDFDLHSLQIDGHRAQQVDACEEFFKSYAEQDFTAYDLAQRVKLLHPGDYRKASERIHQHVEEREVTLTEQKSNVSVARLRAATNALTFDRTMLERRVKSDPEGMSEDFLRLVSAYAGVCLEECKSASQLQGHQLHSTANTLQANLTNIVWALTTLSDLKRDTSLLLLRGLVHLIPSMTGGINEWRVQLIQDIQHYGASTFTWPHFSELGVKNSLVEPAAPIMYCRISAMMAFAMPGFDPYVELQRQLRFYDETISTMPQHQELAIEHGNHHQCIGMKDLLDEVTASPVRWMLGLERRRISRLRGPSYDPNDTKRDPVHMPQPLSSKRRELWKDAPGGLSIYYVELLAYVDDFSELCRSPMADENTYIDRLKDRRSRMLADTEAAEGVSAAEHHILRLYDLLFILAEALVTKDTTLAQDGASAVGEALDKLSSTGSISIEIKQASETLLPRYTFPSTVSYTLELLSNTLKLCKKATSQLKKNKDMKSAVNKVETTVKQVQKALDKIVSERIETLKALEKDSSLVDRLTRKDDSELAASILEVVTRDEAHEYLKSLVTGSKQSLESLLMIYVG